MMFAADFLSEPIEFSEGQVNVLCVENKELYRNIIRTFVNEEPETMQMVFSDNFVPFRFKGNICFINDYYHMSVSSGIIKKLYENISKFCENELFSETAAIRSQIVNFMDNVVENYDFDFTYNPEINLLEMFKMLSLRPNISSDDLLRSLLDFMLLLNKYSPVKCFVLLNLHLYFNKTELELFYKDLLYNHIFVMVLENFSSFENNPCEKIRIIDGDLCELC